MLLWLLLVRGNLIGALLGTLLRWPLILLLPLLLMLLPLLLMLLLARLMRREVALVLLLVMRLLTPIMMCGWLLWGAMLLLRLRPLMMWVLMGLLAVLLLIWSSL